MNLHHIYRITNLITGRFFIGVHETSDPFFANPPCRWDLFKVNTNKMNSAGIAPPKVFNKQLKSDLATIGDSNFVIEAIRAGSKDEMYALYKRVVTEEFLNTENTYNTRMSSPQARENMAEGYKAKYVPEFDENGHFVAHKRKKRERKTAK